MLRIIGLEGDPDLRPKARDSFLGILQRLDRVSIVGKPGAIQEPLRMLECFTGRHEPIVRGPQAAAFVRVLELVDALPSASVSRMG